MTANVSASVGSCMNISANNVTLNCRGYSINYASGSISYGIQNLVGYDNVTIRNCNIFQNGSALFSHGIYLSNGSNFVNISNSTITTRGETSNGIYLKDSSNFSILYNNSFFTNGSSTHSIYLTDMSNHAKIYNNSIFNNGSSSIGIRLDSIYNGTIVNNSISAKSDGDGIFVYWYANFTNITNNFIVTETGFGIIMFAGSSYNTISNNSMSASGSYGSGILFGYYSNYTNVSNNSIFTNGLNSYGVYFDSSSHNDLFSNSIVASGTNAYGLYFYNDAHNNTAINSSINSKNSYAVYFYNTTTAKPENNTIYNCLLNGSIIPVNGTVGWVNLKNFWNTSNQTGSRTYSNGNRIGGNYYTNSSGNGFSDSCDDTDFDGFCDSYYNVSTNSICSGAGCGNNTDYLAYSNDYDPNTVISNIGVNSTSININSTVRFNATVTDGDGVSSVKFYIETPNGNYNITAMNMGSYYYVVCNSTNECKTNMTVQYNLTSVWANDTSNNIAMNTTPLKNFTVYRINSTCSLSGVFNTIFENTTTAVCSCTNSEASATLFRNGIDVTATENSIAALLPAGNHSYVCNVSTTDSYTSASNETNMTVSKATANLTLNHTPDSPILYGTQTNVTCCSDSPEGSTAALYRNVSGSFTDVSGTENNTLYTLPIGYWRYMCNSTDTNYTSAQKTYDYIVTDEPPSISWIEVNSTSISLNQSVRFNATVTDNYMAGTVKFYIETPNGNLNLTATNDSSSHFFIICNSTNECNTNATGVYNLTSIWANDTLGNNQTNTSPMKNFEVHDSTSPVITLIGTNSTSISLNESVRLNATVTDDYEMGIVKFYVETPHGNYNLTANNTGSHYYVICNSSNTCKTNTTGQYNLTSVWANDTSNNIAINTTPLKNFTVSDNIPPIITIISPENSTYNANWTWANVSLDEEGNWCGVSLNGTENQTLLNTTSLYWYLNMSVSEGQNNAKFYCNDTSGNMGNTTTIFFTINLTATTTSTTTSTTVYSSPGTGSPGGGSPGGSVSPTTTTVPKKVQIFVNMSKNYANIIQNITGNVSIRQLYVWVVSDSGHVRINLSSIGENSTSLGSPNLTVYQYINITLENITDSHIMNATINFEVPKTWLSAHGIRKENVILQRHHLGKWNDLNTTIYGENSSHVIYSSVSPGFSVFVVGGYNFSYFNETSTTLTTTTFTIASTTTTVVPELDRMNIEEDQIFVFLIPFLIFLFFAAVSIILIQKTASYGKEQLKKIDTDLGLSRAKKLSHQGEYGSKNNPMLLDVKTPRIREGKLRGESAFYRIESNRPFKIDIAVLKSNFPDNDDANFSAELTDEKGRRISFLDGKGMYREFVFGYGKKYLKGPELERNLPPGIYLLEVFGKGNRGDYAIMVN